jgi:hypothetical protein
MVLNNITFYSIFGIPLIVYGGIITLILMIITAYSGYKHKPLKTHKILAASAIILGILHAVLGFLAYF